MSGSDRLRYIVALVVAAIITGGVVLYMRQTDSAVEQTIRQRLLKQQQTGMLPPELQGKDLKSTNMQELVGDSAMQLPRSLENRIKLTTFLSDFWYIWGPLIAVLCLAAAALCGLIGKPKK